MKASTPAGTRDFSADVIGKREYIFNIIRKVFKLYGFEPLETPAIENLETLTGKYGEEGDKLMFKILNNGLDNPSKQEFIKEEFEKVLYGKNTKAITERALKYDLTIPFARYVATNLGQLAFPFKRYQIQPVWRADRPQKGRYREFYQCDADVAGSNSYLTELDFINIYHDVFTQLKLSGYRLLINNRKILKGILESCGVEKHEKEILVIIDKSDKIGVEGVTEELLKINIPEENLQKLIQVYSFKGNNRETLDFLKQFLIETPTGNKGVEELEAVIGSVNNEQLNNNLSIDLTLARGLEYYTGIIFEVRAPEEVKIGSIGGGGRYDDLTGFFGVHGVPGVGISFGVDRIYDVLEELNLFPGTIEQGTKVLFFNLGDIESKTAYRLLMEIRKSGIAAEIYHESAKLDKQFKYAEKKNIPFVVIIGSRELESNSCVVKNIRTGEQFSYSLDELVYKAALL